MYYSRSIAFYIIVLLWSYYISTACPTRNHHLPELWVPHVSLIEPDFLHSFYPILVLFSKAMGAVLILNIQEITLSINVRKKMQNNHTNWCCRESFWVKYGCTAVEKQSDKVFTLQAPEYGVVWHVSRPLSLKFNICQSSVNLSFSFWAHHEPREH